VWLGYAYGAAERPTAPITLARIGFETRLDIDDPGYVPPPMWPQQDPD